MLAGRHDNGADESAVADKEKREKRETSTRDLPRSLVLRNF